jgi:predicted aldo/keto reductase-like oxidoreductase
MKYRTNAKTGDRISEIAIGSAYDFENGREEGIEMIRCAYENGVNFFDLAAAYPSAFSVFGEALKDVRKNVFYQMHFGNEYSKGEYGWSLDPDTVKRSVEWQLETMQTDYIDYGFIHCIDEDDDWESFRKNGIYDYMLSLKKSGVVKHIALSSHTPAVINTVLDDIEIDMLMFSINPAYDYGKGDEYGRGGVDERTEIYRRCEKENISISVMKPFFGGQLLDASQSPFGEALTPFQCIKYALDKPGVVSCIAGVERKTDVYELLSYYDKSPEELDYSVIGSFAPPEAFGKCVYCNHCKPCPQGINIGLVNKYYDLASSGDELAAEHYRTLAKNAKDCISCGHCNKRCPFRVDQEKRMAEIAGFFA